MPLQMPTKVVLYIYTRLSDIEDVYLLDVTLFNEEDVELSGPFDDLFFKVLLDPPQECSQYPAFQDKWQNCQDSLLPWRRDSFPEELVLKSINDASVHEASFYWANLFMNINLEDEKEREVSTLFVQCYNCDNGTIPEMMRVFTNNLFIDQTW